MRRLVVMAIVALLAWKAWSHVQISRLAAVPPPSSAVAAGRVQLDRQAEPRFQCDGRQSCSQMTSRAEAEFFTRHCPGTRMDGDRDGIPCENDSRF